MTRSDSLRLLMVVVVAVCGCSKAPENNAATNGASPTTSTTTAHAATANSTSAETVAVTAPVEEGDPIVVLNTSLGNIFVRLYQRQSPRTVANFIDYVRTGHYNFTVFHQVEPGYVALGGAFDEQLKPKPVRYPVVNEANNGLKNIRGSLAMARDPGDANSATSMFFINLADNPKLDHQGSSPEQFGFCVFGQVIDGLDVLEKLSAVKTGKVEGFTSMPTTPVVLHSVKGVRAARDAQVQPVSHNQSSAAQPAVASEHPGDASRYATPAR